MKVISQREFRNNSAAVMDAVEAGEVYHVTRNGVEIAEVRPVARRRRLTAARASGHGRPALRSAREVLIREDPTDPGEGARARRQAGA